MVNEPDAFVDCRVFFSGDCGLFAVRPVSMGFYECFMHIKYSVTLAKFHFLHETLRREKEGVSPW
jgi:hypothetical protein